MEARIQIYTLVDPSLDRFFDIEEYSNEKAVKVGFLKLKKYASL